MDEQTANSENEQTATSHSHSQKRPSLFVAPARGSRDRALAIHAKITRLHQQLLHLITGQDEGEGDA